MLPIPVNETNLVTQCEQISQISHVEIVQFTHACFGYPVVSTLLNAVKNKWLSSFPRITAKMITANPPNPLATAQRNLYSST